MADVVDTVETDTTETDEKVIIGMLNEMMSTLTMLIEQVTALSPVEDVKEEETETEDDKVDVEPEGATDDTTEEMSPEEVEKLLFEN